MALREMTNSFPAYKYIITSFFLSGVSTLLLQIAWERWLNCYVGTALPTVALIVATFMIGLGIGAQLAGFLLKRKQSGLMLYAASQLLIGVLALASLQFGRQIDWLLSAFTVTNASALPWAFSLRVLTGIMLLLIPASAIGASFPFLAHFCFSQKAASAKTALLYCFNLLGSALGAILAGFILIPVIGVSKTVAVAAGFNLLALICLVPARPKDLMKDRQTNLSSDPMAATLETKSETKSGWVSQMGSALTIVAISGALSMVLEVLWTRLFMLICGPSSYAFALTVCCQLLAFAAGGTLMSMWLSRSAGQREDRRAYQILATLGLIAGLSVFLGLCFVNKLPWMVFTSQTFLLKILPAQPHVAFI